MVLGGVREWVGEEPVPEMSGKKGDELVPEGVIEGAERNWNQGCHGREREHWYRGTW